jgi:hypothetical protein
MVVYKSDGGCRDHARGPVVMEDEIGEYNCDGDEESDVNGTNLKRGKATTRVM